MQQHIPLVDDSMSQVSSVHPGTRCVSNPGALDLPWIELKFQDSQSGLSGEVSSS